MRERAQNFDPRQIMQGNNFEIFHYKEPKPDNVEVHHHDFYEVYCFLGGNVEYWVEGNVYHLEHGDLLLINPLELHRPIVKQGCPVYERIVLWINKDYLESLSIGGVDLSNCFNDKRGTHNFIRPNSAQKTELISLFSELVRESYGKDFGSEVYSLGLFMQIMVAINRMSLRSASIIDKSEESSELVTKVLSYINEHYSEDISLEKIAQKFFVSKYYLSHEFAKTVGTGVYRYIMLKRLLIAKQLLMGGMPAGEVYTYCGFKDYTNFYRAFKAEYGISPKECRVK